MTDSSLLPLLPVPLPAEPVAAPPRLSDPLADANVTLRDLAAHRTGLGGHDLLWYGSPWGREEIIRRIGQVKLDHSFRSEFGYQNIMYLTAGYAVGRAANCSWEEFVQKRIFDPLGMRGANFSVRVAQEAPDHASPHHKNKDGRIDVIPWRDMHNVAPAGSINASARDMSRWIRFQLGDGTFEGKRLVSAANLAETHTPQIMIRLADVEKSMLPRTTQMSYGLGWIILDYYGHTVLFHHGGIDGFSARVALVPTAKLGIVILTNRGGHMPTAATWGLLDLLLDLPKKDWNAIYAKLDKESEAREKSNERDKAEKRHKGTKPSRELAAYVGAYAEPAYGTISIAVENDALVLGWNNFKSKLEHWHFDTFVVEDKDENPVGGQDVTFTLGADANVARLTFLGRDFTRSKSIAKPR